MYRMGPEIMSTSVRRPWGAERDHRLSLRNGGTHLRIVRFSGSVGREQRKSLMLCHLLAYRTLLCELEAPSVDILGCPWFQWFTSVPGRPGMS